MNCAKPPLHGHGFPLGPTALRREIRGAAHTDIFNKEVVDTRTETGFNRFPRCIHDRLALDIKAGVEHHLPAGCRSDRFQKSMEIRIALC